MSGPEPLLTSLQRRKSSVIFKMHSELHESQSGERRKEKIREIVLDYFILRKKRQGEKQDAIYYGGWLKVPKQMQSILEDSQPSSSSFLDAPLLSHYSWPSSSPFSYIFNGKWYSGHLLSSEYIIEKNSFLLSQKVSFRFYSFQKFVKIQFLAVFHFSFTKK